ncbi:hypothetical protein PSCT_03263 [Pseudomonas sp. SCT]|jgi:hypothetical protein|nr:hypothetical protein [Pseudomonas sp. SCT]GCA57054.1 hypothetical protein PSCT_03263 [Pseudomonas sp. SCT]
MLPLALSYRFSRRVPMSSLNLIERLFANYACAASGALAER